MSRSLFNRHRCTWIGLFGSRSQIDHWDQVQYLKEFMLQERHPTLSIHNISHQDVLV